MKCNSLVRYIPVLCLFTAILVKAQSPHTPFVYETLQEMFATGDFNGDGRADLVIVDKASGKFRLGYQLAAGEISWVECRISTIKEITGFTIGQLLTTNKDALAFTAPDASQVAIIDVSSPTAPARPRLVPFSAALGPNGLVALRAGGSGSTAFDDLLVTSIYNSPDANVASLLRNDGAEMLKISDVVLPGAARRANRLAFKQGEPVACILASGDQGNSLLIQDAASGALISSANLAGLPSDTDYAIGQFSGAALQVVIYKPGDSTLHVRTADDSGGKPQFSSEKSFTLRQPVRRVVTLESGHGPNLLVIFGGGESAGLFKFDGAEAPALAQTIYPTNDVFTCALGLANRFIIFAEPKDGKFSTRYYTYTADATGYTFSSFGGLASLADNDNVTIPDIHSRIAVDSKTKSESEMKPYTNTIPGTAVSFAMVPIRGGEFTMGSPKGEKGRKADEGPQHKVKISPFWMGQYEVSWNEYELFMYPDEEKRTRATIKTDAAGDKLADAVTHPSKPYVEMSFGMGKDGYPAISMTQHGANKFCQWLSAKTGQFYRLPTEAEWEYACRAGSTKTWFFGDSPKKLSDYAWFEQNSDFKYQKVGQKKPNPWGLYDMYGNVAEWTLDQYDPEYYKQSAMAAAVTDPWNKATQPYPHAVRGGSWNDDADACRSASRRGSDRSWKMQDPQLPKSVWYFSDAPWVGFRLVRPLRVPPPEEMQKYWSSGVERD